MHLTCKTPDTQVLVIGNGPAGLSLSAFLHGVRPYYNQSRPHSNMLIHEKMTEHPYSSLLDQNLEWSRDINELSSTGRSLSVLYDMLVRPDADAGKETPSSLVWKMNPCRSVPHMVIAETDVGGSWNDYDPEMLAVSYPKWLDLPGYGVEEWMGDKDIPDRLLSSSIVDYMKCYAEKLGILKKMHVGMRVTSIKKKNNLWITEGIYTADDSYFRITSRAVVLACGKTSPRVLGLENENSCENIAYDVPTLKKFTSEAGPSTSTEPRKFIVVGDGISSVDAVTHCIANGVPVVHVMRRDNRQLRNITISRLTGPNYQEYAEVYQLMIGRKTNPLYTKMTASTIVKVDKESVLVATTEGEVKVDYTAMAVCIGRESTFDSVLPGVSERSFVDYRCKEDPSLFACGSFAGDHFVRYLIGGSLNVAKHIFNECNNNCATSLLCCLSNISRKKIVAPKEVAAE